MDHFFLKKIQNISTYVPSDSTMELLFESTEEITLSPREILIGYGMTDPSLYIVKDGLLQLLYFDGEKEVTFGFAFPETILCSPHCLYMHQPSLLQIEACKISTSLLKVREEKLNLLLEKSHDFAQWMFNIALGQFYYSELKMTSISGHTEEKYKNLLKIRPDIINAVSANRLASYLGVTPSWLCKLRKKMLYE
ncbi:MAG TPA: Crp/Fnr family transcriptional regulator [Candidatus Coprenecus pullicola]|nr:Crp/Fnr family transcriptional regulator [Candidatus Coprenecus pullicola]